MNAVKLIQLIKASVILFSIINFLVNNQEGLLLDPVLLFLFALHKHHSQRLYGGLLHLDEVERKYRQAVR